MRQEQTAQEVLFDQIRAARQRHQARQDLLEFMRLQRTRITATLDACSRRIAERQALACGEGASMLESRTSAGTQVRTGVQPWHRVRETSVE